MSHPIFLLQQWLREEKAAGAPDPQQAVLATTALNATPHARVVAIREIRESDLLFFTQRKTRKVTEMTQNPVAAMTFWFELLQREVILEGSVAALSEDENLQYWETYPRTAQIRFYSYAPTSSEPIKSKQLLEEKRKQVELQFAGQPLPLHTLYCGFRFKPSRIIFYAYRTAELSDVFEYQLTQGQWVEQRLSP